jgi:protein gp37
MGFNSTIEWTTHTFNPWWGCTKVSEGCRHCYAENLAKRYGHDIWGANKSRRLLSDQHWREPLKWDKVAREKGERHRVFCASMADVFEEDAPGQEVARLWELIKQTPHLDWQLLTKRPQRIAANLPADWGQGYDNVWLGTSVESEQVIDRIAHLVLVPAVIHFLSLEPLLGPLPNLPLENIDWVIVGGESGAGSRPMQLEWAINIRDQCQDTGVAFFFKQWGTINKKKAGRLLAGKTYDELPAMSALRPVPELMVSA